MVEETRQLPLFEKYILSQYFPEYFPTPVYEPPPPRLPPEWAEEAAREKEARRQYWEAFERRKPQLSQLTLPLTYPPYYTGAKKYTLPPIPAMKERIITKELATEARPETKLSQELLGVDIEHAYAILAVASNLVPTPEYLIRPENIEEAEKKYQEAVSNYNVIHSLIKQTDEAISEAKAANNKDNLTLASRIKKDLEKEENKREKLTKDRKDVLEKTAYWYPVYWGLNSLKNRLPGLIKQMAEQEKTTGRKPSQVLHLTPQEQMALGSKLVLEKMAQIMPLSAKALVGVVAPPRPEPQPVTIMYREEVPPMPKAIPEFGCDCEKMAKEKPEILRAMDRLSKTAGAKIAGKRSNKHFFIYEGYRTGIIKRGHLFDSYESGMFERRPKTEIGIFTTDHKLGDYSDMLTPQDALWMYARKTKCYCKGKYIKADSEIPGSMNVSTATCYTAMPILEIGRPYREGGLQYRQDWNNLIDEILIKYGHLISETKEKYEKFIDKSTMPEAPKSTVVTVKGKIKKDPNYQQKLEDYRNRYFLWYGQQIGALLNKDILNITEEGEKARSEALSAKKDWKVLRKLERQWEQAFWLPRITDDEYGGERYGGRYISEKLPRCTIELSSTVPEAEVAEAAEEPTLTELQAIEEEIKTDAIKEFL